MARVVEPRSQMQPLTPQRKWQTITIATVLFVPAYWALLAALLAQASDDTHRRTGAPNTGAALALGLALIPFVFIVLAFMSGHPKAPGAVVKAMGLSLLIGLPVSALAGDAVTGIIAGVGAGGICALRMDVGHTWRARAVAVAAATLYTFFLVRTAGAMALLGAPVLPLTGIGVADHFAERRHEREADASVVDVIDGEAAALPSGE
jgi:hypothetical protein